MIYSIGYGGRQSSEFMALLKKYNIKLLVDVRRKAKCTWNPIYCGPGLAQFCLKNHIDYIHKPELGGSKKRDENYFKTIKWLSKITKTTAIMCCEKHYFYCHRYQKIGNDLAKNNFQIAHITAQGKIYLHPLHDAISNKVSNL